MNEHLVSGQAKGIVLPIKPSIQGSASRDKWKIRAPPIEIEAKMQVQDIPRAIWCYL